MVAAIETQLTVNTCMCAAGFIFNLHILYIHILQLNQPMVTQVNLMKATVMIYAFYTNTAAPFVAAPHFDV